VLAALLVAVGICAALWKVLESSDASPQTNESGASSGEIENASNSQGSTSPELQAEKAGGAQQIAPSEPPSPPVAPAEVEPKIRLFGSILDSRDRSPINGDSRVRIDDEQWEERTQSEKIHAGYEFVDLHPGVWELTVEVAGFQTSRTNVLLDRDEKEKRVDLVLLPPYVVKVRVEAAGQELLQMTPIGDTLRFTGIRRDISLAASTSDERMSVWSSPEFLDLQVVPTLLEPGRWIDGDSEKQSRIGRFVARVTTSPDGTHREIARLRALGYTTESDRALTRLPDGSSLSELPQPYCGILELSEPPPAFASLVLHDCVLRTAPIPAGADDVSFSLSREELRKLLGRVRLKVVDADTDASPERLSVRIDQTEFGANGTFRAADGADMFANLLPGPAILSINAPERESVLERILVHPGTTTDLGTYRLQRFTTIVAKVLDDQGEPASALFNVFPSDKYESTRTTLAKRFFRSNHDGVLKIDSIGHGPYLIVAHDENWISTPMLADTTFRQKDFLEIRVSKGMDVALRLRADPPLNGRLAIRTKAGLSVADRACRSRDAMHFRLAPGNYSVELYDGETWLWSEGLAVGAEPIRSYLPR
jgi:hypothetical protein